MNLQGYWKLAACPCSVGKSVASLCALFLLRTAAASSPRSHFSHSVGFPSECRGFCCARRTPPFPRNATPKAFVEDFPCTEITVASRDTNDTSASAPVFVGDASEGAHNVDVTAAASICEVSAAASAIGYCPRGVNNGNAFRCTGEGNVDITNDPGHACDINACLPVTAEWTTSTGGVGAALQNIICPFATAGLVESYASCSSLSNAAFRGQIANKETSSAQLTKTQSLKGLHFRRMLNSHHAIIRELTDEKVKWFPYLDQFKVKDRVLTSSQIIQMLAPFMLQDRKDRIKRVVANRTYTVCMVVEGLLDLGNIAAIFRSADALGFQSVQVISNETERRYKKNRRISMGSEKWLDAEVFNVTEDCFEELRARGYRVVVASATADSVPIFEMDWTIPTAVVFGNEYRGVSREALQSADLSCYIPMEGMVDSFNVSVAAGIVMHQAVVDRKARLGRHGDLSEDEQRILAADFYLRHNSRSLSVINRLLQKKQEERQTELGSVLMGDLELDTELPEYLKLDIEKVLSEFTSV